MKKIIGLFVVAHFMVATAQNLQITNITFDPAPQCPTATNPNPTTTVSVTVVGGKAPYAFSNPDALNVTPIVSVNTGTFVFPVMAFFAFIKITDSSSPALETDFVVNLQAQLFKSAAINFLSPCAGKANGSIMVSVAGTPASAFELVNQTTDEDIFVDAPGNTFTFTNLSASQYEVVAYTADSAACSGNDNIDIVQVDLNQFENSFITNLADYIQRTCQKCFNR